MKRHGATVVGSGLRELVSRSIFLCQNAEYQLRAKMLGTPQPLHPGEIKLAGAINVKPPPRKRTWEYWSCGCGERSVCRTHRQGKSKGRRRRSPPAKAKPRSRRSGSDKGRETRRPDRSSGAIRIDPVRMRR